MIYLHAFCNAIQFSSDFNCRKFLIGEDCQKMYEKRCWRTCHNI